MIKKSILNVLGVLLLLLLFSEISLSQSVLQNYVSHQFQPLAPPDESSSGDLACIGKAIGEARIVMLGEADHFDGTTLAYKSRIVKYLHEQKGFDLILFENDFFSSTQGWSSLPKQQDSIQHFLFDNLFPIWSRYEGCSSLLYDYIPKSYNTNQPLSYGGFDNQLYGAYSQKALPLFLESCLTASNPSLNNEQKAAYVSTVDSLMPASFQRYSKFEDYIALNKKRFDRFIGLSDTLLSTLSVKDKLSFTGQLIRSLRGYALEFSLYKSTRIDASNLRDIQMADNLGWLLTHLYPTRKVIIWSANYHLLKYKDHLTGRKTMDDQPSMVTQLFKQFPDLVSQSYVLGTVSSNFPDDKRKFPVLKNALQTWLAPDANYGFLDLKPFVNQFPDYSLPFPLKALSHADVSGRWDRAFDGLLYIRDNYRSKKLTQQY